jgi:hypothetical protein
MKVKRDEDQKYVCDAYIILLICRLVTLFHPPSFAYTTTLGQPKANLLSVFSSPFYAYVEIPRS